jgi:hypothetical protein
MAAPPARRSTNGFERLIRVQEPDVRHHATAQRSDRAREGKTGMKVLAVVLIIAGLYLLLDHSPPLPLNHEDIGLGETHVAHAVFGVVALVGAVVLWRRGSRSAAVGG